MAVDEFTAFLTAFEESNLKAEEERKIREAQRARDSFAAQDPRRLDIGDGGRAAMAEQNAAFAAAEEQRRAASEKAKQESLVNSRPATEALKIEPTDNPLLKYATYTYNLSLHVIPPKKYNEMAVTPGYIYKNNDDTVLIASGGRQGSDFKRHKRFKEDFYFDALKFTTVVGLHSRSRNTNAIDISFTIIEPMGVTLLNRLLQMSDEIGTNSWMQIPFMLQIDFVGNSDIGEVLHPIPNTTKYIPIRLIGCKIKVTQRGSEYQFQAIPFSHQAFTETVASTPALFEVTAKTIKDFFSSTGSAGQAANIISTGRAFEERQEALQKELKDKKYETADGKREAEKKIKELQAIQQGLSTTGYVVGSYASAMNSFQKQLQSNKHINHPESYDFIFDPEIEQSQIVIPAKLEAKRTKMIDPTTKEAIAAIRAQGGVTTAGIDVNAESFSINPGTSVIDVINMVMRSSKYIRDQIPDPAVDIEGGGQAIADKLKKPINWYKIVPIVQLGDFDLKRDAYSKKMIYHVQKYTYYNTKFKDAPKKLPDQVSKSYQYIYTGKNKDILSFDIDFDTMFYTAMTADRSKVQKSAVQNKNEEPQDSKEGAPQNSNSVTNNPVVYVAGQANMPNPASVDSKAVLVNDFTKSAMSSSRGDMINVKLKIIGDPEFIKQDDVFFNPINNPNQRDNKFDKHGSLIFDAGEIFALIKFRTPVDLDQSKGLMEFGDWEESVFSGVYRIITVENEFTRGMFTQNLDCVRLFDQPEYDSAKATPAKPVEERAKPPTTPPEVRTSIGSVSLGTAVSGENIQNVDLGLGLGA